MMSGEPVSTPPPNRTLNIRPARAADVAEITNLIRELAVYEKLEHEVRATPEMLQQHLFGPRPVAEVLMAELDDAVVGFALFFTNFSTFRGLPGLYLEDLFVRPEARGRGIGQALLRRVAQLAVERGCGRMEWAVLDWNTPSIEFYKAHGARPMSEWTIFRLEHQALNELAARSGGF
jgi:GNAT superfamily N-acetyltransferase